MTMALSEATAEVLSGAHANVQTYTRLRRSAAQSRTEIAKAAQAEGATIPEIQSLLGLSRTGVVKILAGATEDRVRKNGALDGG